MPKPQVSSGGQSGGGMSPQALNSLQRQAVLSQSIERVIPIYSGTIAPSSNNVLNVPVSNVGLIKKLVVEIVGTLNNGAGGTATLTDGALANLLSQVTFTDFNSNTRIQTTGLHLSLLANAKRRHPFSATGNYNTVNATPTPQSLSQMLNVPPAAWSVYEAPATIPASTAATVRAVFEVPLAYSNDDLRGALLANITNATATLGLVFNTSAMVGAAPADYTNAVYQGSVGTFSSATMTISQVFLDQIPVNPKTGLLVVPTLDVSTAYELKNTNLTGIAVNQDFPIPFSNYRDFFSCFLIYNNSGQATGRVFGTDINCLSDQEANFLQVTKNGALYQAMLWRQITQSDLPAGMYYFNYRSKPVSTSQYGNRQLILNASTAGAGAYVNAYWEDMALLNTVTQAGSLAAS